MASTTSTKKATKGGSKAAAIAAMREEAAAPAVVEAAPPATDEEDLTDDDELESDDDAADDGAGESDAPASGATPTKKKRVFGPIRSTKIALKRLGIVSRVLGRFDWDHFGQPGVRGALAILDNAAKQIAVAPPKPKSAGPKVAVGGRVRPTDKGATYFEDVLSAEELEAFSDVGFKVVEVRAKALIVEVPGPNPLRIVAPLRKVEAL